MGWMLFFMIVVLKIPLAAAIYVIWWAVKEEPQLDEEPSGEDRGPHRRLPPKPRWPRRGPAGGGAGCKPPPCPQEQPATLERPAPAYARRSE